MMLMARTNYMSVNSVYNTDMTLLIIHVQELIRAVQAHLNKEDWPPLPAHSRLIVEIRTLFIIQQNLSKYHPNRIQQAITTFLTFQAFSAIATFAQIFFWGLQEELDLYEMDVEINAVWSKFHFPKAHSNNSHNMSDDEESVNNDESYDDDDICSECENHPSLSRPAECSLFSNFHSCPLLFPFLNLKFFR